MFNETPLEPFTLTENRKDTKPEEYAEYNAYCEECKAQAKAKYNIGE